MPGKKHEARVTNSLAALLSFYEHVNTASSGTFRMHVEKLFPGVLSLARYDIAKFPTLERTRQCSSLRRKRS
jgi:hypothetical protein